MLAHGAAPVGWKIAASIPGVDARDGCEGLIFGFLTTASVLPAGGPFSTGPTVDLCGEVELGVRLGSDVDPDADLEAATAAVDAVGVALEIVDVDIDGAMHEVVTSNVFHRALTFGPARQVVDLRSVTARLRIDGQMVSTQSHRVDPGGTVWTMARLLGAVDERLRAGDWIIGGSIIHVPVAAGQQVTAMLDGLGEVSLQVDASGVGR
jgi:2-keto-4-pentenoate hydratase